MDSNSLPMVSDLHVVSRPVRHAILGVLGVGVFLLVVSILFDTLSTPTVTLEATVVDSAPPGADADVYSLSGFSTGSPVRTAVAEALRSETGSASAETTTERYRAENLPTTEFYVRHDGRVVRVAAESG